MKYTYETRQHPRTGEIFAVKIDPDGNIWQAAGPLATTDPTDAESLYGWIINSQPGEADEDGDWLQSELHRTA